MIFDNFCMHVTKPYHYKVVSNHFNFSKALDELIHMSGDELIPKSILFNLYHPNGVLKVVRKEHFL